MQCRQTTDVLRHMLLHGCVAAHTQGKGPETLRQFYHGHQFSDGLTQIPINRFLEVCCKACRCDRALAAIVAHMSFSRAVNHQGTPLGEARSRSCCMSQKGPDHLIPCLSCPCMLRTGFNASATRIGIMKAGRIVGGDDTPKDLHVWTTKTSLRAVESFPMTRNGYRMMLI